MVMMTGRLITRVSPLAAAAEANHHDMLAYSGTHNTFLLISLAALVVNISDHGLWVQSQNIQIPHYWSFMYKSLLHCSENPKLEMVSHIRSQYM